MNVVFVYYKIGQDELKRMTDYLKEQGFEVFIRFNLLNIENVVAKNNISYIIIKHKIRPVYSCVPVTREFLLASKEHGMQKLLSRERSIVKGFDIAYPLTSEVTEIMKKGPNEIKMMNAEIAKSFLSKMTAG